MRSIRNIWLTTSALSGCVCLAAPSLAWAAEAQPADATTSQVQEVVITAQKRTERLSDAPVAASVLPPSRLASTNSSDISDLNKLVPSVQLNGTFNGRVPMGVRGISSVSNESTVGIASGVEVLVDGVPVPSDSMAGNALEDVARIEVLKGPQSTLGGRTASAGEISVITYGPTASFAGGLSATFTDDNEQHVIGHVSGPLGDKVEFSLAGWGHHLDYPIHNLFDGKKSYANSWGTRGKLRLHPTDNLDVTVAAHYGQMDSHGSNFVYSFVTPGATLLFPGSPLTQALLLPGVTPSLDNQTFNSVVPNSGASTRDYDVALTLDYRLGDFTLSSTTSYQHEHQRNTQDLFVLGVYFFDVLTGGHAHFSNTQTQTEDIDQTTEEIKLVSPADKPLTYVVGAFYSDSKVHETYLRLLPPAGLNLDITPDTKSYAVYGRGSWKVLDHTTITAGLRYNRDNLSYVNYQTVFVQASPPSCALCFSQGSNSSDSVVGDISLQQKFASSSMVYFTYARGYAPKAYNTSLALTAISPPAIASRTGPGGATFTPGDVLAPVGQEHINHFELGLKGNYFDRRLNVNLALFDTRYSNYQIQSFSSEPGVINPVLILDATGSAETRGIEVDAVARPTEHLTVGFNAAYIDAKFTSYANAPAYVGETINGVAVTTQDISGKALPNSPKFKFNVNVAQNIPLASLPFDLTLNLDYTYRTSAQMLVDQNPHGVEPAFGLLNLGATLTSKNKNYSATLFVNNVTDQHYFVDMEDFFSGPWAANAVTGQPARDAHRFFGVRLEAKY
ncbi:MAG TPA: TonB-dependent receptor [Caulobacteraceae bacterium]